MPQEFGEAPPQTEQDFIHLPTLLADYMGVSRSVIRMEIAMGTVEIDGVESKEKFDFRRDAIAGKTVTVYGQNRQFRLLVPAE